MAIRWTLAALLLFAGTARAQIDVRVIAGATSEGYQAWVNQLVADHYWPAYVNGFDAGGTARFAAVALKEANPKAFNWEARHDLTLDGFEREVKEHLSGGWRLVCVSGYRSDNLPRFAAVWTHDRTPPRFYEAPANLTHRQYEDLLEREKKKRLLTPLVVSAYTDEAGALRFLPLFAGIGVRPVWEERHDLTAAKYQEAVDEWVKKKGYRPISVAAYRTGSGPRFAAVFLKDRAKVDVMAKHGLDAAAVEAESQRLARQGYHPVSIAGYTDDQPAGVGPFDQAMATFMTERAIPAGTLAVSMNGKLLLSRGYGVGDPAKQRRVEPDDPFRIASVTKPITAAAVRKLIAEKKLSPDTPVFPLLGLNPPAGKQPDPRLKAITVEHLLLHQGGWDRDRTFDPMFRPLEIAAGLHATGPAGPVDIIRYMQGVPLQFDPGSQMSYSNFGYCVLGRVIEKVSGQPYVEYVQKAVLAPLGVTSVRLGRSLFAYRERREPNYRHPGKGRNVLDPSSKEEVPAPDGTFYLEAMDSHGGLIASSPDLVRFLDAYWLTGHPRQGNGQAHVSFGQLPGTFAMVMQRPNGVNVAALFNQSSDPSGRDYRQIEPLMRDAADGQSGAIRFAVVWMKN